jgi:uncharacterized protein
MIVISDTSALSALIRVGQLTLLKSLFGSIIIPEKVAEELNELNAFHIDISEFTNSDWIIIKQPTDLPLLHRLLTQLDEGEANAITLAVELSADLLIIDELKGRSVATALSINITGLAGILILAKQEGYLQTIKPLLDRILKETSFRISSTLYNHILIKANENI